MQGIIRESKGIAFCFDKCTEMFFLCSQENELHQFAGEDKIILVCWKKDKKQIR